MPRRNLSQEVTKAIEAGDTSAVKALLARGAHRDPWGRWPLTDAASIGHVEILEVLLQAGDDVNALETDHSTALMEAAEKGHLAAVRLLLDHGAAVDRRTSQGCTALMKIAQHSRSTSAGAERSLSLAPAAVSSRAVPRSNRQRAEL